MESIGLHKKFSDQLKVRAIIGILGLVATTTTLILFDIFRILGISIFSASAETAFYLSIRIIEIVDIILAFFILSSIKNLKSEAQHVHFTQFHSKLVAGVIIMVVQFVYTFFAPLLFSYFVNPFFNWDLYYVGRYFLFAAGYAIGFLANILMLNAWAHFLRYAKMKQLPSTLIGNINLIKIGFLFLVIMFLIKFFSSLYGILAFSGFPFGYLLEGIIGWGLYIGDIIFMIFAPLLLLISRFQLSKSIKNTRISASTEPTLGNFSEPHYSQIHKDRKYCRNCGASALLDAVFCPSCGNSF